MQISEDQVVDFNRAHAQAFGTQLSPEEARTMLANLVELYTRLIAFAQAHPTGGVDQLNKEGREAPPSANAESALD